MRDEANLQQPYSSTPGRALVPATVVAVALAVWPGASEPFSLVKTALLGLAACALLLRAALAPGLPPAPWPWRALAGLWVATLALSALTGPASRPEALWLPAAAGLALLALLQAPPEPLPALRAVAGASTVLAVVALLQFLGADPFGWLGWAPHHPGERMRVYGTLGNPSFVAAWLGSSLWVTLAEAAEAPRGGRRAAWLTAAALQLGGLAATRSWGALLALAAGAVLSLGVVWRRGPRWRLAAVAVLLAGTLGVGLAVRGRPLERIRAGRAYLWRVAAPHVAEAPLLGHGPGAFVVLWPEWEAAYWRAGATPEERRFVAEQDHAHMDFLEWLLELGVVGLLPRAGLLCVALWTGWRAQGARERAMGAALAALAARALVDFPLARPGELCLCVLWVSLLSRSKP